MFEKKPHFPNELKKNITKYVETRDFSRTEAEKLLRFIAYMYRLGAMKQPQGGVKNFWDYFEAQSVFFSFL